MHPDWIDDILAVIDTGSFAQAAERRFVTQSAFTRRIRMIEAQTGATLFDRSRKPVAVMPGVMALEPELREISSRLRRLKRDMRAATQASGQVVTLVCQHAITTTVSPAVVRSLTAQGGMSVRVRSANRDACLTQLISGEADLALTYNSRDERQIAVPRAVETRVIGSDQLVPVAAPGLLARDGTVPVVLYPADVFLGQVFDRHIVPRLTGSVRLVPKAETALTLAACEYALGGIGAAWVPRSVADGFLTRGALIELDDLPDWPLDIVVTRLSPPQGGAGEAAWQTLVSARVAQP